ncbi:MAG: Re/Si-specific NAD(P)(+) transhydrogenase subunit alpha [Leptolyngbya sp. PLA1]|nr:Re/Si-specific NAD(P)(+) transhydrogenase subunit alpha [Leptolyngbya sp. PLA1]
MKVLVPRETAPGEQRVALAPDSVKKLVQAGYEVQVEAGAGLAAGFTDEAFAAAGATSSDRPVDLTLRAGVPTEAEVGALREGSMLLGSLFPTRHPKVVRALAARGVTAFSTDAVPRTTRAQSMDTLSSMANIAGYKGVLLAAAAMPRYCPMLMTAAGTILPAKFFVIGAGVAGLQAIATARRLGASVFATDVRPEVKEQIQSVGAKYVGIELRQDAAAGGGYAKDLSEEDKARQRELLAEQCAVSDVVVTTALIGGVFAPRLLTRSIVARMKPGAVIVDLAADGGGNCELSKPGRTVVEHGVTIIAPLNLAATLPADASTLWGRNLTNFILAFTKDRAFVLNRDDEIIRGCLVTHQGQVVHARAKEAVEALNAS